MRTYLSLWALLCLLGILLLLRGFLFLQWRMPVRAGVVVVGWTWCFFLKSLQDLLLSTGALWENSKRGSSGLLGPPLVPFQLWLVEHGDPVVSEVYDCWNWRKARRKHIRRVVSFQCVRVVFSLYGAFLREQSCVAGWILFYQHTPVWEVCRQVLVHILGTHRGKHGPSVRTKKERKQTTSLVIPFLPPRQEWSPSPTP